MKQKWIKFDEWWNIIFTYIIIFFYLRHFSYVFLKMLEKYRTIMDLNQLTSANVFPLLSDVWVYVC